MNLGRLIIQAKFVYGWIFKFWSSLAKINDIFLIVELDGFSKFIVQTLKYTATASNLVVKTSLPIRGQAHLKKALS
jgi:hypothetical protein